MGPLTFMDDDGERVVLAPDEAEMLLAVTGGFDAATVSGCPGCGGRVLAVVALVDLLDAASPHPRTRELIELADDAPTLHLYVVDGEARCQHREWLDPGYEEWLDAVMPPGAVPRRP